MYEAVAAMWFRAALAGDAKRAATLDKALHGDRRALAVARRWLTQS